LDDGDITSAVSTAHGGLDRIRDLGLSAVTNGVGAKLDWIHDFTDAHKGEAIQVVMPATKMSYREVLVDHLGDKAHRVAHAPGVLHDESKNIDAVMAVDPPSGEPTAEILVTPHHWPISRPHHLVVASGEAPRVSKQHLSVHILRTDTDNERRG